MAKGQLSASYSKKREMREARQKRDRTMKMITWGGLILVGLAVVGALIWFFTRPTTTAQAVMGDEVAVTSRDHIAEGTDPGPYSTDPPVGGHHYPVTYDPGFYSPQDILKLPKFYQGYLVHDMEHGYVIYWYNCQADPKINCTDLQNAVKQVVTEKNNFKVIGFPWPSQKEPLVMTSWGRILRANKIDIPLMRQFYSANVDKGPEQTPN